MPIEGVGGLLCEKLKHKSTLSKKFLILIQHVELKYHLTISILDVKILVQFESCKGIEGRLKM